MTTQVDAKTQALPLVTVKVDRRNTHSSTTMKTNNAVGCAIDCCANRTGNSEGLKIKNICKCHPVYYGVWASIAVAVTLVIMDSCGVFGRS